VSLPLDYSEIEQSLVEQNERARKARKVRDESMLAWIITVPVRVRIPKTMLDSWSNPRNRYYRSRRVV